MPANLISLQIGYKLCLYDGMTTAAHVGLQLVFPAYLYVLMFLFALLSKRFSWLSRYFSPTQTFLTLIIMSYSSVLETCVSIIYAIKLTTLSGRSSLRWHTDPNQPYFAGWHLVLVILSTVLLAFYIIPLPFIMLCPAVAYRYAKHFKPFYDAMWAPFELKFRFWLGVRVLTLVVLYFVAYVLSKKGALFFTLILFIFLQFQSSIRPFRNKWMNILDGFLTADVILLLVITNYSTFIDSKYLIVSQTIRCALIVVSLGMSYIMLSVAFIFNLLLRFPSIKRISLKSCASACLAKAKRVCRRRKGRGSDDDTISELSERAVCTATSLRLQSRVHKASFTQLRETLLDY